MSRNVHALNVAGSGCLKFSICLILSSILTSCSLDPLPKSGMAHPRMPADHLSGVKHMPVVARGSPIYPQSQIPDICYDTRLLPSGPQYEPPQFSTGMNNVCF